MLVVCDNQQKQQNLPTRVITLAITSLRVFLAVVAKLDLETLQLDAVNAFIHATLDKTVFMRRAPGYGEQSRVFLLNRVLYSMRQSLLLWRQKLTDETKKIGFKEIHQELCVLQKDSIICFFYMDDIVFALKNDQRDKFKKIVASLSKTLTIKRKGK